MGTRQQQQQGKKKTVSDPFARVHTYKMVAWLIKRHDVDWHEWGTEQISKANHDVHTKNWQSTAGTIKRNIQEIIKSPGCEASPHCLICIVKTISINTKIFVVLPHFITQFTVMRTFPTGKLLIAFADKNKRKMLKNINLGSEENTFFSSPQQHAEHFGLGWLTTDVCTFNFQFAREKKVGIFFFCLKPTLFFIHEKLFSAWIMQTWFSCIE
jgi:hypothetical protein